MTLKKTLNGQCFKGSAKGGGLFSRGEPLNPFKNEKHGGKRQIPENPDQSG